MFEKKKKEDLGLRWSGAESSLLGGKSTRTVKAEGVDRDLIFIVLFLLAFGALMVYSASISYADNPKYHTQSYHFLVRHLFSMGIAFVAAVAVFKIRMKTWMRIAPYLGIIAVAILVIVLIPGIGKSVNGSRRWIGLGIMNLQVTEIVKVIAVICAANFTVTHQEYMHSFTKGFLPMLLSVGLVSCLIGVQPDMGATMVIILITMGVLYLGGLNNKIFAMVTILVVIMAFLMIYLSPWRLERMTSYLDVWGHASGKGYQLSHSLIAFGRGELFGVGLGDSVEKLHYLPEAHTDFILAVVAEELGFVGFLVVLVAFYLFVRRAFAIGRQAIKLERVFSGLVAEGIGIWIGVQVIINAGVATGLFPTKGLTLPLISYGGSSLLATMMGIAMLFRVDYENRILMRGGKV